MAKFTIYSPDGVALYTGTPSFTGQYMKPGMLEFREISSPRLIDFTAGCYVGYVESGSVIPQYSRTGFTYKLYSVPQVKKQARPYSYGAAFVYQGVQFFDSSKMLEYCPFRDLVTGDNRIHFSTQPSISTFEGCDGLARRFEACLIDQYGAGSWQVRIATAEENPALHDLMLEPRDFTVSGVNILECLDKIYEIWPEVGWVYNVEEVDGVMTDTIVIGGGGANPNVGTYAYGKGNGLTSITRTAANAEEIANRIFAYGSSRNMVLPSWYRNQEIKDAESVDIQNLMLPIGPVGTPDTPDYWPGWGETDGERDAAKAFVENAASILKNGLRPATVYFNGNGEYPEIYPTIRETTIGMVRTAIDDSTAKYYPSTTIYTDPDARIDKLLSVQPSFDSGKAGEDGKQSTLSEYITVSGSLSDTIPADTQILTTVIVGGSESPQSITFGASDAGIRNISMPVSLSGYIQIPGITGAVLSAHLHRGHPSNAPVASGQVELTPDSSNPDRYNFVPVSVYGSKVNIAADTYYIVVELTATFDVTATATAYSYSYDGGISVSLSYYRAKTFNITLRQVGFDIGAQADLADGKTIAMRTGDCAGRSFSIKSVQYDSANDAWALECWRSEDESLSQWFPNSQFGVAAGDEFVLLDIAMPDIYIAMASQKLLVAARELLADSAVERWQYNPEIDAKYMVENSRTIRSGEYMAILDMDFIEPADGTASYFKTSSDVYLLTSNGEKIRLDDGSGSVTNALVDTIVINEGESAIPTYKVTLRDRKKKTWTESAMPETSSSKSVGSTNTTQPQSTSGVGDSFFQLDESGNVTLKSQYQNLWVPGWLAAGGVGEGGGGGGASYLRQLTDVYHSETSVLRANGSAAVEGDALVYNPALGWVAASVSVSGVVKKIACGSYNNLTPDANGLVSITDAVTSLFNGWAINNIDIYRNYNPPQGEGTAIATITIGTAAPVVIKAPTSGGTGGSSTLSGLDDVTISNLSAGQALVYRNNAWRNEAITPGTGLYLGDLENVSLYSPSAGQALVYRNGVWQNETIQGGGGGGYVGYTATTASPGPLNLYGIPYINATNSASSGSRMVWDSTNNAWHFYGNIYADGWIAAGGVGSGGGGGYVLPIASASTLGGIKVGSGLSINASGVLSVTGGGGGGGSTVEWGQTGEDFIYLSVDGTAKKLLTAHQSLSGYVTLATAQDNISGAKTFTTKTNFTGGLAVPQTAYIDLGPIRIKFENNALHITKVDPNDNTNYGLYADGFVAAGGVGQSV